MGIKRMPDIYISQRINEAEEKDQSPVIDFSKMSEWFPSEYDQDPDKSSTELINSLKSNPREALRSFNEWKDFFLEYLEYLGIDKLKEVFTYWAEKYNRLFEHTDWIDLFKEKELLGFLKDLASTNFLSFPKVAFLYTSSLEKIYSQEILRNILSELSQNSRESFINALILRGNWRHIVEDASEILKPAIEDHYLRSWLDIKIHTSVTNLDEDETRELEAIKRTARAALFSPLLKPFKKLRG